MLLAALAAGAAPGRRLEHLPQRGLGRGRARRGRPRADQPADPAELPAGHRGQHRGPAVPRRGRGLPQLHLRQVRRGDPGAARRGRPSSCSTPTTRPMLRTEEYDSPGASVVEAGTLPELAAGIGVDAGTLVATIEEFNAAIDRSVPFDPTVQGRPARRGRAAEEQLGAADRAPAVLRLPRHLRDHLHLRRAAGRHRRPGAGRRAASDRRACSCAGRCSAGCSAATTPAAPGWPRARSSAAGPARWPDGAAPSRPPRSPSRPWPPARRAAA